MDERKRFWAKVRKSDRPDDCWLWTASLDTNGYGQFRVGASRGPIKAHRKAWELTYGPVPAGLFVLHSCDVRACVFPGHLFIGNQTDNMRDAAKKGRTSGFSPEARNARSLRRPYIG